MGVFSLEASDTAYRADFGVYGAAVVLLATLILLLAPRGHALLLAACVAAGTGLWGLVEYTLHRFVLHGVQPFQGWHAEHHRRPAALIGTPTILSVALFATLVFAPAWALAGLWPGLALTLGMLAGYLAYAVTHHATHHAFFDSAWLRRRRRWHALHHRRAGAPGCYGVSTPLWDHLFGSARPASRP